MARFALLSDEDMAKLYENSQNKNTKRSTNNWISVFKTWANVRGKNSNIEDYVEDIHEMDKTLGNFFGEVRKQNGQEYEPDSLRVMQGAIQRYLVEKKCNINILSDVEFESSRRILEGKARLLRKNGMGKRPNASQPLTLDDEELLWKIGKLGVTSPTSLLHTMWYLNIQHFGLRGVQEHTTMSMDNFIRKIDDEGTVYIEFLEDPTKCRGGGLHSKQRVTDTKMFATGRWGAMPCQPF